MENLPIIPDNPLVSLLNKNALLAEASRGKPWVTDHLLPLEVYHKGTFDHSMRVAQMAVAVGQHEHMGHDELLLLGRSGLLHDIGKMKVPLEILDKPGKLNEHEKLLFHQHPKTAFDMLKNVDPEVARIVVGHHEYQVDSYPRQERRLEEDQRIVLLQSILALVDHTDAMMSERVYKSPFSAEQTIEELGKRFPLELVEYAAFYRKTLVN